MIERGLRVLVTAGANGIGLAMASKLADHGARIHVCDIDPEALAACRENHPAWGCTDCDVSDPQAVEALFKAVADNLGGLDVLINNAGIAGPTGGIETLSPESWQRTINVNLDGQFYCARLAIPMLRESRQASIICMSSVAGRLGYAYRTPYAASKWAIVGLVKSLAIELGPQGIRTNAILPGVVSGPRIEQVISARAQTTGVSYEEMEADYISMVSLRRMVSAEDIANQALYLCSPLAKNINGQAISVCGNMEHT